MVLYRRSGLNLGSNIPDKMLIHIILIQINLIRIKFRFSLDKIVDPHQIEPDKFDQIQFRFSLGKMLIHIRFIQINFNPD